MRDAEEEENDAGPTLDFLTSNQETEEDESLESNGCRSEVWMTIDDVLRTTAVVPGIVIQPKVFQIWKGRAKQ
jgi:hypothetical protein